MNLDEAIRRLEQHTYYLKSLNAQEQVEAHKLGIEALKTILEARKMKPPRNDWLLPGETEEGK